MPLHLESLTSARIAMANFMLKLTFPIIGGPQTLQRAQTQLTVLETVPSTLLLATLPEE